MTFDEEEAVAKAQQEVIAFLQAAIADQFDFYAKGPAFDRCKFATERIFFLWWVGLGVGGKLTEWRDWQKRTFRFPMVCPQPQRPIGPFTADFTVDKCVIEIDGHWHEKTPDAVIRRNQRDEYLARAGWTVLHCSARELLSDPRAAVLRVAKAVVEISQQRAVAEQL